jgi:hypothetical protein
VSACMHATPTLQLDMDVHSLCNDAMHIGSMRAMLYRISPSVTTGIRSGEKVNGVVLITCHQKVDGLIQPLYGLCDMFCSVER